MAHKVLSKDMGSLIQSMKLAQKYSKTTVEEEYRKGFLQSAHTLIVDAKNLLDTIDGVRLKLLNGDLNMNEQVKDCDNNEKLLTSPSLTVSS